MSTSIESALSTVQTEQELENQLIAQLQGLGYEYLKINNEKGLEANLKAQLEKHNKTEFSNPEFEQILQHLHKGSLFERAQSLRGKFDLRRDDDTVLHINFLDKEHWCRNEFQVTKQFTMEGKDRKHRYDVTILINGLPLVQVELKRSGIALKEAFNQIERYKAHSYRGLFGYVQLFVVSNGVDTKYCANAKELNYKQAFFWADEQNKNITRLSAFAEAFLEPCRLAKMIARYIVLNKTHGNLMVLRPYQHYAVEAILHQVQNTDRNGYIWHTTGSGKTLTSFKAAQLLRELPKVHKVVFVVDRKDLDAQTCKEYNAFSPGSVETTEHTRSLVTKLSSSKPEDKLIVTTIQKLGRAISYRYANRMEALREESIVFIFDECHRSQFGDMHKDIKSFFKNNRMFGFTGTPILAENAVTAKGRERTTEELFTQCLHKYVITNAIADGTVLRFSIEYFRTHTGKDREGYIDQEVEGINTKEVLENEVRLRNIVRSIIEKHDRKTHGRSFTAMFCVSGINMVIKYYNLFKELREAGEHRLNIAAVFSVAANGELMPVESNLDEDIVEGDLMVAEPEEVYGKEHRSDILERMVEDYNQLFGGKFSVKDAESTYNYTQDIAKRVKNEHGEFIGDQQIDILLVSDMFLTGFDSKKLNTLYVDKNLQYHGLIQAFSRTNRTYNERKSHGNIVCFRKLKEKTDKAILLFGNPEAKSLILLEPYESYLAKYREALVRLENIAPTADSVNDLVGETEQLEFVQAFRDLIGQKNVMEQFADYKPEDMGMSEQTFLDYKSKYLELYESTRTGQPGTEKVSILEEIDFQVELIQKDEINVDYILNLIMRMIETEAPEEQARKGQEIMKQMAGEPKLRSKQALVERFLQEQLPLIKDAEDVHEAYNRFQDEEELKAINELEEREGLQKDLFRSILKRYRYKPGTLKAEDLAKIFVKPLELLDRKPKTRALLQAIQAHIEKFD